MADSYEILHITDCHLVCNPEAYLHGWPVAAAFEHVLAAAVRRYPGADALVLGGDLVDDESVAGYRWLNRRLAGLAKPVLAVAGNHDNPQTLRDIVSAAVVHDTLSLGGWQLIGLCSHQTGREDGALGETALAELDARLAARRVPTLICVHHPPFAIDSAWLDRMGLIDGAALRSVLASHDHVHGVLCGHVHQQSRRLLDSCEGWTTPSTMRQFRPLSDDYAEDSGQAPGYRWLRLDADGSVVTKVHRCNSTPGAGREKAP